MRVFLHRRPVQGLVAQELERDDLAVLDERIVDAGDFSLVDGFLHAGVERLEAFGREAKLDWIRDSGDRPCWIVGRFGSGYGRPAGYGSRLQKPRMKRPPTATAIRSSRGAWTSLLPCLFEDGPYSFDGGSVFGRLTRPSDNALRHALVQSPEA